MVRSTGDLSSLILFMELVAVYLFTAYVGYFTSSNIALT